MKPKTIKQKKGPGGNLGLARLGIILWLVILAWSPGLFARSVQGEANKEETRWYSIRLGEETVGYVKETGSRLQQAGRWYWKSVTESKIVLRRLGQKVEMRVSYEHLETDEGLLKKITAEQLLAGSRVRTEIEVEEDRAKIKNLTGNQVFSREIPSSGRLLGPVGIGKLTNDKLKRPGDKVEYRTILAELAQVISGERTLVGEEVVDCGRNKMTARKVIDRISQIETTRQVWLDMEGNEVKAVEPSPFGDIVTCLSSEQEVMEAMAASRGQEQFFQSSLIRSNVRLPQARGLDRLVVRLKHSQPELGWPDLANEYQKILENSGEVKVVELKRVPLRSSPDGQLSAEEKKPYLEANTYIDINDPEIKRIASEVAGREKNVFQKALKLRDWVSRNLAFDAGFVFAPASEVMKAKKATCAGYAALLAALLRAAGIPSRYLMGIVYANGIWGGHAWVEAWLEGRWVPLDAALPSPGAADPARIAIARSSLAEGPGGSLVAAQKFFGSVSVEVLEFSLKGRTVKINQNQPLYEVKDNRYWNPGLQLGLRAPDGFTFAELDGVWPDRTLLALKGPDGQVVRLFQEGWFPSENLEKYLLERLKKEVNGGRQIQLRVWGKKRPALVSAEKSALAILNGTDLFLLVASGKNSEKLLAGVAAALENRLIAD
ncbi:MAG: Transglutaminase domain protein [Candidatus Saccharicenans subterraneus]|uniref:Transglutaminase domain protein n=1 Tax=Candidatus Saccharicenans subterraneus TaxID=2508984 RepID=A0A3E2BLY8_9BACT|nr:MAG: Transglutaminase domain protein [Candidatus Saccharicenans subterraneum]